MMSMIVFSGRRLLFITEQTRANECVARNSNLQDPNEAVVELGIDTLEIIECDRLGEELLVEGQREAAVQVVAVEDGDADDPAHEVEVRQVVL